MVKAKRQNVVQSHFEKVMALKTTPDSIAMGFAIGTFFAIFPTPGFSVLVAVLLILAFPMISKYSLLGAMAFWNPITLIPVYSLGLKVGSFIMQNVTIRTFRFDYFTNVYNYTLRFIFGNTIIAILFSLLAFFIVKQIVLKVQSLKK